METEDRIPLGDEIAARLSQLRAHVSAWATEHQCAVGAAEMAAGAALLAYAVSSGSAEFGTTLFGTPDRLADKFVIIGPLAGALIYSIGSVCVAGMGSAIGVPAVVLAGGGALIFSALGYTAADVIERMQSLGDSIDPVAIAAKGGLAVLGIALLVDGARRIASSENARGLGARIEENTLVLKRLAYTEYARTRDELIAMTATDRAMLGAAGITAIGGGAAAGSALAAASVTLAGSHTVGGAALALGVISAPIWPVIVGGSIAGAAAVVSWRFLRAKGRKRKDFYVRPTNPAG